MTAYIIRRILQSLPLLLGISILVFGLLQLIPGGPMGHYMRVQGANPEDIEILRKQLGLDKPAPVQYVNWLTRWLRGDWGKSYITREPVKDIIAFRLPNTILLMGCSFTLALIVGMTAGIVAALKQYSILDNLLTIFSFIGFSVPVFWLGLIMILVFTVKLGWLPGGGMYTLGEPFSLIDRIRHLIMPVSAAALYNAGIYSRYLRSGLLEVINLDYIRTARAKGLRERAVFVRHAMRNALMPLVTIVAMDLPWLFGGAVLTETIFSWPGMGREFWKASLDQDYPEILTMVMLVAIAVVVFNLLADVLYAYLDPRIRYD
jgi:peptide/nickel transport system permease protein